MIRYKLTLLLLFLFLPYFIYSQEITQIPTDNALQQKINEVASIEQLKHGLFGFYAVDVSTNQVIASYNEELSLCPASNLKIISTATALEIFGPEYRFKTEICILGEIDTNGTLNGNIIIRGGGDPALGSQRFGEHYFNPSFLQVWVDSIMAQGIKKINGKIIGDATIFSEHITPGSWTTENVGNYFGAGACGLSIYDNTLQVTFKSSSVVDKPVTITKTFPEIDDIQYDINITSSNNTGDEAYFFGGAYENYRYAEGTIPKNKTEFVVNASLPNPPLQAAHELENILKTNGISIENNSTTARDLRLSGSPITPEMKSRYKTIAVTYSPRLIDIISKTNFISMNLYAEHLLNHIGYNKAKEGSTNAGCESVTSFWTQKGMDTDGFMIADGSGLSRYNAITTKQLAYILTYMKTQSTYSEMFYESLPVVGESGTVRSLCVGTAAVGKIHAKSGSIRGVRAFSGYALTASGRVLAFSMIANNFSGSTNSMRKKMEEIMVVLANISF